MMELAGLGLIVLAPMGLLLDLPVGMVTGFELLGIVLAYIGHRQERHPQGGKRRSLWVLRVSAVLSLILTVMLMYGSGGGFFGYLLRGLPERFWDAVLLMPMALAGITGVVLLVMWLVPSGRGSEN